MMQKRFARSGPKIANRVSRALYDRVYNALYNTVDAYRRSDIETRIDLFVETQTFEDMLEETLMEHYDTL